MVINATTKDGMPMPIPTSNAIWSERLKPLLGLLVVVGAVEANDEDVRVVDEVVRVFVAATVAGISSVGGKGKERTG
jgi:hypothetical protein